MADENVQAETNQTEATSKERGEFSKTLKGILDKGVESSKKGLKSAGAAISEFGDKSVIHIDIAKLKAKLDKKYKELGIVVANQLAEEGGTISKDSLVVSDKLSEINEIKVKIQEKEEAIKKYEK